MKKVISMMGLASLSISMVSASTIDAFNNGAGAAGAPTVGTPGIVCFVSGPTTIADGSAFGGSRTLQTPTNVQFQAGTTEGCAQHNVSGGTYRISSSVDTKADFEVTWTSGAGIALDGNLVQFQAKTDVGTVGLLPRIRFTAGDGANTSVTDWVVITATGNSAAMSQYSAFLMGSANLGSIRTFTMQVQGDFDADLQLDNISAVPEPGTFTLAGGALIALGLLRRRRA